MLKLSLSNYMSALSKCMFELFKKSNNLYCTQGKVHDITSDYTIWYKRVFVIWLYNMFLVHVNACDFADTMLIVVQINFDLIWFDIQ